MGCASSSAAPATADRSAVGLVESEAEAVGTFEPQSILRPAVDDGTEASAADTHNEAENHENDDDEAATAVEDSCAVASDTATNHITDDSHHNNNKNHNNNNRNRVNVNFIDEDGSEDTVETFEHAAAAPSRKRSARRLSARHSVITPAFEANNGIATHQHKKGLDASASVFSLELETSQRNRPSVDSSSTHKEDDNDEDDGSLRTHHSNERSAPPSSPDHSQSSATTNNSVAAEVNDIMLMLESSPPVVANANKTTQEESPKLDYVDEIDDDDNIFGADDGPDAGRVILRFNKNASVDEGAETTTVGAKSIRDRKVVLAVSANTVARGSKKH